jgi:hypothetical protein
VVAELKTQMCFSKLQSDMYSQTATIHHQNDDDRKKVEVFFTTPYCWMPTKVQ